MREGESQLGVTRKNKARKLSRQAHNANKCVGIV